jgi:hypothetical protein
MTMETQRFPSGAVDTREESPRSERLAEERARQILERAAALDAKHSSEIDVEQLREAAVAAGISAEAFEQALREDAESAGARRAAATHGTGGVARVPSSAQVAHFSGMLRDLLGEDTRVVVDEDRIEARDKDGFTVTVSPSSGDATATVAAHGRFRDRIFHIVAPAIVPMAMGFLLMFEEEEAGIGLMLGVLFAVLATLVGGWFHHRKEREKLRKKAERIRRQLQRMLGPGKDSA